MRDEEDRLQIRLRQLGARPVDLSRLRGRIAQEISVPPSRMLAVLRGRLTRAIAAALLVGATLALLLVANWSTPALASSDDLLRLHGEMLRHGHITSVASVEAANRVLTGQWADAPRMPELPEHQSIACSVHRIGRANAACVMVTVDETPVTLAAAEITAVRVEGLETRQVDGRTYHVESAGPLNMVMTQHGAHWYCMMGTLPQERLIAFWASLEKP